MGCFNHKCNFSQLPVRYGDRIVVLVGVRMTKGVLEADNFAPGNSFTPISVPIRGTYNDYGSIENVERTAGIEALEAYFGMDVCKIVDCAERISCGCKNQIEEDYKIIHETLQNEYGYAYYNKDYDLEFSYIMEHEAIFDSLISITNNAIKDVYHWRLPYKFFEDLGYRQNVIGKDNGYDVIEWTHDTLPTLKECCYIWKYEDFGNYEKVCNTISEFCDYIGCEVPEKYNSSFYETCFISDIEDSNIESIYEKKYNFTTKQYTFSRNYASRGLFRAGESSGINELKLISLGDNDQHLDVKYMKEVIEVALLYDAMDILQMTWNNTNYYRQDIDYDYHINFLKKCLAVAEEKKTSYD